MYIVSVDCVVFGASGYGGAELVRILSQHPKFNVVAVGGASSAGRRFGEFYGVASADLEALTFLDNQTMLDMVEELKIPAVFLALPHGESQRLVPRLMRMPWVRIIDLAGDFRLSDQTDYEKWYGAAHTAVDILGTAVYGLPEMNRDGLDTTRLTAVAGCYVTASTLAMLPLVAGGWVQREGIIIDAASGVSGAGRSLKGENLYGSVAEDFKAYGLRRHRHSVEMEKNLGATVLFTPHLAPMMRGILATCYLRPSDEFVEMAASLGESETDEFLRCAFEKYYDGEPFIRIQSQSPSTKSVMGTNLVSIMPLYDERNAIIIAISAIDNLTKGAAGQAVQCANIMFGFEETMGLSMNGIWP